MSRLSYDISSFNNCLESIHVSPVSSMSLTGLVCYLLGSIPFSLLIGKMKGVDLRQHGSGNIGATNVARTLGAKWGLVALFFDAMKGLVAVGLVPMLLVVPGELATHQQVLAAVMAVVGHMYSCWIQFRGGKGVATALGAVSILAPWGTLIACGAFLLSILIKRIISLGSIVAAVTFAVSQLVLYGTGLWTLKTWSLGVFSVLVPALIVFQHRSNISRLLKGEEKELQLRRSKPDDEARV